MEHDEARAIPAPSTELRGGGGLGPRDIAPAILRKPEPEQQPAADAASEGGAESRAEAA